MEPAMVRAKTKRRNTDRRRAGRRRAKREAGTVSNRSVRIRALLAAGMVLGLGVVGTLAA